MSIPSQARPPAPEKYVDEYLYVVQRDASATRPGASRVVTSAGIQSVVWGLVSTTPEVTAEAAPATAMGACDGGRFGSEWEGTAGIGFPLVAVFSHSADPLLLRSGQCPVMGSGRARSTTQPHVDTGW
jgi:hypothetical protein